MSTVQARESSFSVFRFRFFSDCIVSPFSSGAAAIVYRGTYNGRDVAVKVWQSQNFKYDPQARKEMNREIAFLS
jgi:hypothetical protein